MIDAPGGGVVRLRRDGDRVWFEEGAAWVSGKVVDGTFPSYEQVIPVGDDGAITTPTTDLREALHAVTPRGTPGVKLVPEIDAARMRLLVDDGDGNVAEAEVIASFSGKVPAAIGFNAQYIREVIDALTKDNATVKINMWGELDPVRVDAHGVTVVIMPLRV